MKIRASRCGGLRLAWSLLAIVVLLSSLAGSLALPQRVTANDGQASVSLEGPTEPVSVGSQFQVRVKLGNVADLYGAEFHLSFDPDLMEVVDADPNLDGVQIAPSDELFPFVLGSYYTDPNTGETYYYSYDETEGGYSIAQCEADNANGRINYAITLLDPASPVATTAAATLAVVTFHCKAAGEAQISFSNPAEGEPAVKLADFEDNPISYGELQPITITQGLPDLVVKEKSESWVNEALKTYQVSYIIKNQGNVPAPAGFDIALIVNGRKVEEQEITSALAPSEEHSATFSEVLTLQGDHDKVIVVVDCNREVEESNEINNVLLNFFPPLPTDLISAIENGKAWLAAQQNADGSWGNHWQVAKTALAVLKFELEAFEQGLSPFDPSYTYSGQVEKGFNYIFANAYLENGLSAQIHDGAADNPDLDGDNQGVFFLSPVEGFPIYETSIVAMAIAASNAPGRVINVPGSPVDGWTFEEVLRDVVDYLAWAQTDKGFGRGGWNYEPMDNYGPRSDESNTGWVTLGLAWAEAPPPLGFGLAVPGFVKRELGLWLRYIQNSIPSSPDEGGAGYTAPFEWVNILKTGNLLQQLAWLGATPADPRVQKAVDYLVNHWNDANDDPGWKGFPNQPASYHATYTVMRGLDSLHIPFIGPATSPIDWFGDMANVIISQQNSDGSWPSCIWDDHDQILATEWALLTLERVVTPPREGPDLVIESKSEDWTVDQSAYVVGFTVKNQGSEVAKAPFQVSVYVDGNLIQEITVNADLGPGETASFTSSDISWTGPSDEVLVCADRSADPAKNNVVDELNEANNCLVNIFPPSGKPDLVVLQKGEEPAEEQGKFEAYFVLQNKGTATASAGHDVALYVNETELEKKEIPVDIPPGGLYVDAFNTLISLPEDALWAEVEVCADVNDEVDELYEDNNCLANQLVNWEVVKWGQLPELCESEESQYPECFCGWDEFSWYDSADEPIVADDWPCRDDRPITDIHWWGSYEGYTDDVPPSGAPQTFHIGIWSDEVDTDGKHHPGELIAEWTVNRSELNEHAVGCDVPYFLNQPETTFEYNFIIPQDEWFYQDPEQNQVYWLSISAVYPQGANPQYPWGWLTREYIFGSSAIRITDPQAPVKGAHYAAGDPITVSTEEGEEPVDMSFALTSMPALVVEQPDLVISNKYEEWVQEGSEYRVHYRIKNEGNARVEANNVRVDLWIDLQPQDPMYINIALDPGESDGFAFPVTFTLTDETPPDDGLAFDHIEVMVDAENIIEELNEGNNKRHNVISWPQLPELGVWKWEEPQDGSYLVHYYAWNIGNADAGQFDVALMVNGTEIDRQTVTGLSQGDFYEGTFGPITPSTEGVDRVEVCVDPDNDVTESDESDNCYLNTYSVQPRPDLVVQWKWEEPVGQDGNQYTVHFVIRNIGNDRAPAGHDVGLYIDDAATPDDTLEVDTDLAPGQSFKGEFGPITLSGDSDEIKVCADVYDEVQESIEDNNCQTNIWPPGEKYTLEVNVEPEGAGTVTLDPTQPTDGYDAGTLVTLTATPAQGYAFDHWSGDLSGSDNPTTITMDSNKSVTAHFITEIATTVRVNAPETVPEDVDFTVTIDISEVDELNAVQYDISFDTSVLRLDDVTAGTIDSTSVPVAGWNEISVGTYRIVQSMGTASVSGSGSLAVLHFHAVGTLGSSTDITITNGILSNMAAEQIPAIWIGDSVEISVIPGDADGNGTVNVLDMTKVARIILMLDEPTPGADADRNGQINVLDMTKIARIILMLD